MCFFFSLGIDIWASIPFCTVLKGRKLYLEGEKKKRDDAK